jgi:hypothetical protein
MHFEMSNANFGKHIALFLVAKLFVKTNCCFTRV